MKYEISIEPWKYRTRDKPMSNDRWKGSYEERVAELAIWGVQHCRPLHDPRDSWIEAEQNRKLRAAIESGSLTCKRCDKPITEEWDCHDPFGHTLCHQCWQDVW